MSDLLNKAMADLESAFSNLEPEDFYRLADSYAPTLEGTERALNRAYTLSQVRLKAQAPLKQLKRLDKLRGALALVVNLMEGVDLTTQRAAAKAKRDAVKKSGKTRQTYKTESISSDE